MDKNLYTPRFVLKRNVTALMGTKSGPNTQMQLSKRAGVAQSTIGRILSDRGENARIETIEKLAKAYGLQGWQLMVAGMDPTNPPVLQAVSKEERELYDRLKGLAGDMAKFNR